MQILLNGKSRGLESATTIEALLRELGLDGRPVLVEHNRKALFPREFASVEVRSGDEIEIIELAAGG